MSENLIQLLDIMEKLRDPETGCPWDIKQDFKSIAPYTIEEAYEVADAIEQDDMIGLKDELGDLLLQIVFHAQMAKEAGLFTFGDVAQNINDKMIRRHPHVFGDVVADTPDEVIKNWEDIKEEERGEKGNDNTEKGALDGIAKGIPALLRASKMQKRAARVGFEWPQIDGVMSKIGEEFEELCEELEHNEDGSNKEKVSDELGDLLFVLADLARWQDIDPEECLRKACSKFERRFKGVESKLAANGKTHADSDLEEMDFLWDQVKAEE